jgi:hypothetical protein
LGGPSRATNRSVTAAGPTFDPEELAGRKLLAPFDRAAAQSSAAGGGYRTPAHPGSANALPADVLPMAAAVAVLVILAWTVIPAIAGAWRTRTQDA